MSYILDALKKSDQERQSNQGPTLQTILRPTKKHQRAKNILLTLIVCVFVAAVASLVGYFWAERPAAMVQSDTSISDPSTPADRHVDSAAAAANQNGADSFTEIKSNTGAVAAKGPTVAFSELPDNIRNDIPALTFSLHVYSAAPSNRTIIINKRRVKEGDQVLTNLQLTEITQEGVVLEWKGHPFYINVVENW